MKWLHLSDLHFNYENYDTKKMRYELVKFLSGLGNSEVYDAVFITGDISYQNKKYTIQNHSLTSNTVALLSN